MEPTSNTSLIHPLSAVSPEARIGAGVEIGPFCNIAPDVEIGAGTRLLGSVTVMDGARIGSGCTIFPGAVVGAVPQDLKFRGEQTTAEVGDNTVLRECVTVNRGTASKGFTRVGSNCLIMAYCHVAHDCEVGNGVIISNATQLAGEVVVDDCAVIGGGTMVHQFCHLGAYVMIQGGALINKDIPPFVKAARHPISYAGVNVIGMRRHGFSADDMRLVQDIYRILFQSGLSTTNAVERIRAEVEECQLRERILNFVAAADRGILKGYA